MESITIKNTKKKPIKVGIDFDGVIAYNPFRVIRAPVTLFKRNVLGIKKTKFYIPKTRTEKFIWALLHESSIFPANGIDLLKKLVNDGVIEAHLVTARYSYLNDSLYAWLNKHDLPQYFASITVNMNDEQPHIYKARIINEKQFDYFIEDNWDIVEHISKNTKTEILWIYNVLDRFTEFENKFPFLRNALLKIESNQDE